MYWHISIYFRCLKDAKPWACWEKPTHSWWYQWSTSQLAGSTESLAMRATPWTLLADGEALWRDVQVGGGANANLSDEVFLDGKGTRFMTIYDLSRCLWMSMISSDLSDYLISNVLIGCIMLCAPVVLSTAEANRWKTCSWRCKRSSMSWRQTETGHNKESKACKRIAPLLKKEICCL